MPPPSDPSLWLDVLRGMNAAMAFYVAVLAALLAPWWARLDMTLRFLLLGMLALSTVLGWGALESLLRDVPGGSRTIAAVPAHLWTCVGVTLAYLKHRTKETP
ncbi:hypothetical protein GCM10009592_28920 [Brachybacterium rhamnosum]|uniref:Holin n=1 Tax=Brachybacterium rhamnosum TaxID=173361 RepID=A0ABW4Q065_9MICO